MYMYRQTDRQTDSPGCPALCRWSLGQTEHKDECLFSAIDSSKLRNPVFLTPAGLNMLYVIFLASK